MRLLSVSLVERLTVPVGKSGGHKYRRQSKLRVAMGLPAAERTDAEIDELLVVLLAVLDAERGDGELGPEIPLEPVLR